MFVHLVKQHTWFEFYISVLFGQLKSEFCDMHVKSDRKLCAIKKESGKQSSMVEESGLVGQGVVIESEGFRFKFQ